MEQMKTDTDTGRCFSSLSPTSYHNGDLFNIINHKKANYLDLRFSFITSLERKKVLKNHFILSVMRPFFC